MDDKRFERDGKYAAKVNYGFGRDYLLDSVVELTEQLTLGITSGTTCQDGMDWALDYLETGLNLLGVKDAAALVKTNLPEALILFAKRLKKWSTANSGLN
jgi:hypothetical protein